MKRKVKYAGMIYHVINRPEIKCVPKMWHTKNY